MQNRLRIQSPLDKSRTNVRIASERNVPIVQFVQGRRHRGYVRSERIEEIAIEKCRQNWRDGITFNDLTSSGIAGSKEQAQRMLKYSCHKQKNLFTMSNRKPQLYYPNRLRGHILENIKKIQQYHKQIHIVTNATYKLISQS